MIGSFPISCCNFLTFLILTTQEIPVECKLITCLPKAFPVLSPLSFSSRCLYSAYVFLMVSSLALSLLDLLTYLFLCIYSLVNTPCPCLWLSLSILVFYAAQCLLLVYQRHLQKSHHRLICFLEQPLPLLHVEITTIWEAISAIKVISITLL